MVRITPVDPRNFVCRSAAIQPRPTRPLNGDFFPAPDCGIIARANLEFRASNPATLVEIVVFVLVVVGEPHCHNLFWRSEAAGAPNIGLVRSCLERVTDVNPLTRGLYDRSVLGVVERVFVYGFELVAAF